MLSIRSDKRGAPTRAHASSARREQLGLCSHMRNWAAEAHDGPLHSTPLARYETARVSADNVGSRLAALVAGAHAEGFETSELLGIPAIRQAARAARRAVDELHASRVLLAS